MFAIMQSRMSLKMCHVWSISRSLGQILEKPCVRSRGHNFLPDNNEIWSECLSDEILNDVKCIMSDQKVGH